MAQPCSLEVNASQQYQQFNGHSLSPNGFHGHFGAFGHGANKQFPPFATSVTMIHSSVGNEFVPPSLQRQSGRCSAMETNGFSSSYMYPSGSSCSNGFSRKRSFDDEHQNESKRQRISAGGYECNVIACSQNVLPYQYNNLNGDQVMEASSAFNTSVMEHQNTVVINRGYEDMYTYDMMISEFHGC